MRGTSPRRPATAPVPAGPQARAAATALPTKGLCRDHGWEQRLPGKQVINPLVYPVEACILHTAGAKAHFYGTLLPRWLANVTSLHPDPVPS